MTTRLWLGARRGIDLLGAVLLLVVLSPVLAAITVLVRLRDGRPVLVHLPRIGRDGTVFRLTKFRTMVVDHDGARLTGGDDRRITALGARLRARRLDELPQLLQVAAGTLGLVGPRPEDPAYVDMDDASWRTVLTVRPGIAGVTQLLVHDWETTVLRGAGTELTYVEQVLPVKVALDRWYAEHASPVVDLLVATALFERFVLGRSVTRLHRSMARRAPGLVVALPGAQDW